MNSRGFQQPRIEIALRGLREFCEGTGKKNHVGKGTGLFLLVKPSGTRSWVQRIVSRRKRREPGLGSPSVVTLGAARDQAFLRTSSQCMPVNIRWPSGDTRDRS